MKMVLVGNPNCGKTTLFNRLTGSKQKVGINRGNRRAKVRLFCFRKHKRRSGGFTWSV